MPCCFSSSPPKHLQNSIFFTVSMSVIVFLKEGFVWGGRVFLRYGPLSQSHLARGAVSHLCSDKALKSIYVSSFPNFVFNYCAVVHWIWIKSLFLACAVFFARLLRQQCWGSNVASCLCDCTNEGLETRKFDKWKLVISAFLFERSTRCIYTRGVCAEVCNLFRFKSWIEVIVSFALLGDFWGITDFLF